jgi:hypothetical protein
MVVTVPDEPLYLSAPPSTYNTPPFDGVFGTVVVFSAIICPNVALLTMFVDAELAVERASPERTPPVPTTAAPINAPDELT